MQKLQAEQRREAQRHPREGKSKRAAPCSNRNPMLLTLTQQNQWLKTRTVQQPQPNAANPNTAESMVKNAHRTATATQCC
jgi:hypothetical protein